MNNIWNMTKKDLAVFFRDRGALIWLFVLPLVFIVILAGLSSLTSGGGGEAAARDNRVPMAIVNLDANGEQAKMLVKQLSAPDAFRLQPMTQSEADSKLNKYSIQRYLLIPETFSADLAAGKPVTLNLITHPNSDPSTDQNVMTMINGVARNVSLELQIINGIQTMGQMQAANPNANAAFSVDRIMAQAKSQFEQSSQNPLVGVSQVNPAKQSKELIPEFDLGASILPGMSVLFVFLAAMTMAHSLYTERQEGSLRRLVAAPLRRSQLLLGKMLPMLIVTLIQVVVIFLVGGLLLPLLGFGKLGLGNDPLALVLVSIAMGICSISLGIFLAGIARTEGQITGIGNGVLWVAGFLGGAIVPAFIIQQIPVMNIISRFIPHSWATTAYYDLLARGRSLVDVLPNIGMLLLFSAVFFYIGLRRFKFE
jgi:ABC-2 type transport system permease protein